MVILIISELFKSQEKLLQYYSSQIEGELFEVQRFIPSVHKSSMKFGLVLPMMMLSYGICSQMRSTVTHFFYLFGRS